jgi:hypothetical protein
MMAVNLERRNGGFCFAAPTLQPHNEPDLVFFHRLRTGSFEGPANGKLPALPEVADSGRHRKTHHAQSCFAGK